MTKKRGKRPRKGFTRSRKEWEETIAGHIGKFVDRITVTDLLNLVAFGAGSYATYKGIQGIAAVTEVIPDWLQWVSPLSPFLYQLVIPSRVAQRLPEHDRIILALLGGYSMIKLAPVVVRATMEAAEKGAIAVG